MGSELLVLKSDSLLVKAFSSIPPDQTDLRLVVVFQAVKLLYKQCTVAYTLLVVRLKRQKTQ